jgi:hypothetical protein
VSAVRPKKFLPNTNGLKKKILTHEHILVFCESILFLGLNSWYELTDGYFGQHRIVREIVGNFFWRRAVAQNRSRVVERQCLFYKHSVTVIVREQIKERSLQRRIKEGVYVYTHTPPQCHSRSLFSSQIESGPTKTFNIYLHSNSARKLFAMLLPFKSSRISGDAS